MNPPDVAVRWAGHSSDWRANRWSITCSCKKTFSPISTRLRTQDIQCPKCGREFTLDYNAIMDAQGL